MGKSSKMFGQESIGKLLFKFSIPIIISFLISELYNMVDTLFIGRSVGGLGIGALVLVFPIQRIIIAFSLMIAVGTSTYFSRTNGEQNIEKSKKILQAGFSSSATLMIIMTGLIFVFREGILIGLGASSDILPFAKEYLGIIIFGSTFLSLTIFISNIMVAMGNNKISIISTSIGAILNIILDYILVVNLKMGVRGAAIATTVSQVGGFTFALWNYIKLKKQYKMTWGFSLDRKIVLPIVLVGISAFIVEAEDGILMAVLNNLLGSTVGDSGIVVLGLVSKLYMFLFITMLGIAAAMQPIAAYNAGTKDYKRLKTVMNKTTLYAFITSSLLWGLSMVFTPQLLSLFVKDRSVIAEASRAFRIMVSVFPIISVYYVSIYYFQALGKAKTSIVVSVLRQIIIMLPLSVFLVKVFKLGAMGVWLAYPISDILASIISYVLIKNEGLELKIKIEKQIRKEALA